MTAKAGAGKSGLLDRLARAAMRRGVRQGMMGGSRLWQVLGAAAWLLRFLARKSEPKVVTERLKVGESIVVTNLGPPATRRQQRRDRRQAVSAEAGRR